MEILNYTAHMISIELPSGEQIGIGSSGIARCAVKNVQVGEFAGVPIVSSEYGEITGLPDPVDGVVYVVSMLVAQRAGRADVLSPDSGPTAIRENGQVVAVRNLVRF